MYVYQFKIQTWDTTGQAINITKPKLKDFYNDQYCWQHYILTDILTKLFKVAIKNFEQSSNQHEIDCYIYTSNLTWTCLQWLIIAIN